MEDGDEASLNLWSRFRDISIQVYTALLKSRLYPP